MTGPDHDKFCDYHGETMYGTRPCMCDYIERIRADERSEAVARMAKTIQDMDTSLSDWDLYACLVHAAADESVEGL
jgi:hypothetical protein